MSFVVIAPVGDNLKALFIGMKEFPTEKVILITPSENLKAARGLSKNLENFTIKSEIVEISGNMMEEMFKAFGKLCSVYSSEKLLVNVATGDRISTCAALSAAFANGLKAFGVMGDTVMLLPIMKLSYYNELSDNKLKIMKALNSDSHLSLNELKKKTSLSIALLSYHVSGTYKHKGLKHLRLVETKEEHKNLFVKLSQMGNLLLKGYIKKPEKD